MTKMVNFGSSLEKSSLDLNDKLDLISNAIKSAPSTIDIANTLSDLMILVESISGFTTDNYIVIQEILNKTNVISSDPKVYFGSDYHRYWSKSQFVSKNSKIILFLLANNKTGVPNSPVLSFTGKPISLTSLSTILQKSVPIYDDEGDELKETGNEYYLDIDTLSLVSRDVVIEAVNSGVDGGLIDDKSPPKSSIPGQPSIWLTQIEEKVAIQTRQSRILPPTPTPTPTKKPKKPKP